MPVDLAAKVGWPRSEEVEAVSEDGVSPFEEILARMKLEARDGGQCGQDRTP
jgi:hypothetical protein